MKANIALVILLLLCVGLGAVVFIQHGENQAMRRTHLLQLQRLSNDVMNVNMSLSEQRKVNMSLETNLSAQASQAKSVYAKWVDATKTVEQLEAERKAAAAAAKKAQEEILKREERIANLEEERDNLSSRLTELNISINSLGDQISQTEQRLAASEGDRDFLLQELKRLQKEKSELERQFSDLAVLREQVGKLKDQLSIARRLEWIRRGFFGMTSKKGAERLKEGFQRKYVAPTNFDLNVEIRQDGGAQVLPSNTNPASVNE